MKAKFAIVSTLLICGVIQATIGQVTEIEKKLRAFNTDSVFGWKKGGFAVFNLSQTSLTHWSTGGENSLSINGFFSVFANYKKEKSFWDNSLDVGYGFLRQKKPDYMKTDDKIDLLSKYGRKAFEKFYYAVLINFKTQMTAGYNYPNDSVKISNFFAPAYIIGAIGADYRPDKYFSLFFAPATAKMTIVSDQKLANEGAYGVTPAQYDKGNLIQNGKKTKGEVGSYLRMIYTRNDFKCEFLKNLSFTTKLDLFSNYIEKPENIVVSWETLIALKVNKYLSVNINTHLKYDDKVVITEKNSDGTTSKIGPRVQFKEIFGIGFSYKF